MKNIVCIMFAVAAAQLAAETVSVKSPDGRNEIRLATEPELSFSVVRDGKERVAPTPVGMEVEGVPAFGGAGMKIKSSTTGLKTGRIETPIYKKASVDETAVEKAVLFENGWRIDLVARDDGVAYRMASSLGGRIKVLGETGGVAFPSPDVTLDVNYVRRPNGDDFQTSWESINETHKAADIKPGHLAYLPLVARYADGAAMCAMESDLRDYPGLNLLKGDGAAFKSAFARFPDPATRKVSRVSSTITSRFGHIAETDGTRTFPWRVFILEPSAVKLCESDIVYALAAPSQIGDASWIRPGLVSWDWWNGLNLTGVKFRAGVNTKTYEYFIDFAARNGVPYVILDEGWGVNLDLFEINPEVDLKGLLKYARRRGVGLILWCTWHKLAGRQQEVFSHYAGMGVKGFKIDFMDSDDQYMVRFVEETARIAAEYRLVIDYHGMYKPAGLSRTYPNVLNYEGVHGMECMKWKDTDDFPANDLKSFFVRMTAGPMDYTPGAMRNKTKGDFRHSAITPGSQGTRARQMAMISLYEAPLQMLSDSPTVYESNAECFDFMKKIPTVWDETVGVAGDPLEYAVCARRKGDTWYLSAIGSWNARKLTVDTAFLKEGRWTAEVFADGVNADRDATDYVHFEKTLTAGDKIEMDLAPGGGWTARISPKGMWPW